MSCSRRPKRGPHGLEFNADTFACREVDQPALSDRERRRRLRFLAEALVEVWVESGGLEALREEARSARLGAERLASSSEADYRPKQPEGVLQHPNRPNPETYVGGHRG